MPSSSSLAGAQQPSPLRNRGFSLMLLASLAAFFGYALLLPVVPLWAVRQGAGAFAAGAATGVFMGSTVAAQFAVPAFVRRFGYRAGLLWGALLVGAPAPLLIVATSAPSILAISLVRGLGFGLLTVCGSALIAELLPTGSLARGAGLHGLAVGVPQLLGLSVGTAIAEHWAFPPVFLLATALPAVALVPTLLLPKVFPRYQRRGRGGLRSLAGATWAPWAVMLAVSTGFGALTTFLPIALENATAAAVALFLAPGAAMLTRWLAGQLGDRLSGPGRMLPAALAVSAAGLLGVAVWTAEPVLAVVAVTAFGAGFGVVQNDSLVTMFARSPAGQASMVWNVAFDAGTGLGAVAVGAIVSGTSFPVAFGLVAVSAFALLPVAIRARHPR